MFGEGFDGGVIPGEGGREVAAQPRAEVSGEADSLGRVQPVNDKRFARVNGGGGKARAFGDAGDEPLGNGRGVWRERRGLWRGL